MGLRLRVREPVDDAQLTALHAAAFGYEPRAEAMPMAARLDRHDISWVTAHQGGVLVGFVRAVWDGGIHAFVLDTIVDPARQGQGVGTLMLATLAQDCQARGIRHLHVDFEAAHESFYRAAGFAPTGAGLLSLTPSEPA